MQHSPRLSKLSRHMTGLLSKVLHGFLLSLGIMFGIWVVFAFQTAPTAPSTSGVGTGTADTKNESLNMPLLTQSGGTYNRNTMSLQGLSDALNFASPNNGLYNNRIVSGTFPLAYDEVCFKGGVVTRDTHTAGQSTAGGNCVPGDIGYVIEQNRRTATTWEAAKVICLTAGMRLPEPMEWKATCNCAFQAASYSSSCGGTTNWSEILNMPSAWEWASNAAAPMEDSAGYSYVAVSVLGNSTSYCSYGSFGTVGNSNAQQSSFNFRCVR